MKFCWKGLIYLQETCVGISSIIAKRSESPSRRDNMRLLTVIKAFVEEVNRW